MMKRDAAGNGMNDEEENKNNNMNNYNSSDIHIGDDTNTLNNNTKAWGTWEELLLACAVKRHGFCDWDSVALEVQSRSSLPLFLTTPHNCKQKYRDLKRRFQEPSMDDDGQAKSDTDDGEDKVDNIPWLEQLRSLRVAELRRELHRYDISILSLQLKVKKLEEERDRSVGVQRPDLDNDSKGERSENDGTQPARTNSEKVDTVAAEESDRENRSMNESNSTASGGKPPADGDGTGRTRKDSGNPDPDPVCKAAEEGSLSRGSEMSHSGELGESGTSAGFGRTWKRKGRTKRNGEEDLRGGGEMRSVAGKSQPLMLFLDMIRAHPRGSLFERRLRIQEGTEEYKRLIRRHLDVETIEKRVEEGYYSSSTLSFYRDILLLLTNSIIIFPKSSSESVAAHELRTLVANKIKQVTGNSGPSPRDDPETSDSSLTRQKSSAPLVVCKKKSWGSAKASPSSSSSQKEEKKSEIVTGVRSSRRTNKGVSAVSKSTKAGNKSTTKTGSISNSPIETPKTDKKTLTSDKKKSVADFLERITKNSPKKGGNTSKDQNKKKDAKTKQRKLRSNTADKDKKKAEEDDDETPLKRNTGRQLKKAAEAVASGKRGRDTASDSCGKDNKQPKKRTRR